MSHLRPIARAEILLLTLIVCVAIPSQLFAHRPIFTEDRATGADTAIPIKDPRISQVVYREMTRESPQIWLSFSVPKDFKLFIQIGVPVIDRLKDFRPAMVVVGPGLPEKDAPFALPKATGARVFPTKDVAKPRFFHEHFTGTDSWILRGETVTLSKPGRYYLVAYSPQNPTGKLWLSVGTKESFSVEDFGRFQEWSKKIRSFHEVK